MAITRYDHRKLAFEKRQQIKKRRRSSFGEDEIVMGSGEDCLLGALGARQGAKSQQSSKWRKVVYNKNDGGRGHHKQGIPPTPSSKHGSNVSLISQQKRRSSSTFGGKRNQMADMFYNECMDMISEAFSSHEDLHKNEMDELQEITLHLQMKQQNREKEKTAEEYMEIKTRMTDIMENFEEPDDEEDEFLYGFGDEDEGRDLRQEIWEIIKAYEEVCRERESVLLNVYSDFDNEDEISAAAGESVDIESFVRNEEDDIDLTTLDQRTRKNKNVENEGLDLLDSCERRKELHEKLIRIFREGRRSSKTGGEIESQLRELKLQKDVVGQFKKLQADKEDRKEKLNTWKYAATEIVDLLQTVRKEGATDIERLESEFSKLLAAFKAQSEMAEKFEQKLEQQKLLVKQTEELKKKVTLENVSLQDEYDRCRAKMKTVEIKCLNLEAQLKQNQPKDAVNESEPKGDTPSRIALKDDVTKLTGEVKLYKEQFEKEKAERERVERLAAEKASFYENRNQEEANKKRTELNATPEVIKKVITECDNCARAEERVKELTAIESNDKKEIAELRSELRDMSTKIQDYEDARSNVSENVLSSTDLASNNTDNKTSRQSNRSTKKSKPQKNKDSLDVKEDTLKVQKRSRGEKRNSKINIRKSNTNLSDVGTPDVTPSHSREVITEIKYIEKIKSAVKSDKTTQATFEQPANKQPVEQICSRCNGRDFNQSRGGQRTPFGTPQQRKEEESNGGGGGFGVFEGLNLGGGMSVDQEFSTIAKRILGYVRVIDNMSSSESKEGDNDQPGTDSSQQDDKPQSDKKTAQTAKIVNNIFRPTSQKQPVRNEGPGHERIPTSERKLDALAAHVIKEEETSSVGALDNFIDDIVSVSMQDEKTHGQQENVDSSRYEGVDQSNVDQAKRESFNQEKRESFDQGNSESFDQEKRESLDQEKRESLDQEKRESFDHGHRDSFGQGNQESIDQGKRESLDQGKRGFDENNREVAEQSKREGFEQSKGKSENQGKGESFDQGKKESTQQRVEKGDSTSNGARKVFDPEKKRWVHSDKHDETESAIDAATARRASVSLRHESRRYSMPTSSTLFQYKEHGALEESDIQNSWDESGFFDEEKDESDDSLPTLIEEEGSGNKPKTHWALLKSSGKARQLLRFLTTIGDKKCSHISENMHDVLPSGKLDKEIASKLRVYASHAVDMLGIISFAVKKLQLKYKEGEEDKPETIMTKLKQHWKPVDASSKDEPLPLVQQNRRRQSMMNSTTNDSFVPAGAGRRQTVRMVSPIPRYSENEEFRSTRIPVRESTELPYVKPYSGVAREQSANDYRPQQPSPTNEEKERLARIAEKKRQKILERHKKLVDRLKAGGASTKQIYAILGISKKGDEDNESRNEGARRTTLIDGDNFSEPSEEKKFSIVGNGVRQRRLGFTSEMHSLNGVMNFNHQMVMKNRMLGMNNHHRSGMLGMTRGGEGMIEQSQMMGINTSAEVSFGFRVVPYQVSRDTPRMVGFPQANTNNYQSHGYQQHNRGFISNRLGAQRNPVVFPSINNNKNIPQSLGVASTPLTSLNFFKTKPINNSRK